MRMLVLVVLQLFGLARGKDALQHLPTWLNLWLCTKLQNKKAISLSYMLEATKSLFQCAL